MEQIYKVRDPSGAVREIKGPAGATDEQVIAKAKELFSAPKDYKSMSAPVAVDPTEDMSGAEKFLAGSGKAFSDLLLGTRQMFGSADQKEVDDVKARDSALMNTGAGQAGNLAGNIASFLPTSLIPGANTIPMAALTSGVYGAMRPTDEGESRLANVAISAATGGAAQYGLNKVGAMLGNRTASASSKEAQNAVRDATLKTSREAGYVVPPATVTPSATNRVLESFGGKAATAQVASTRNQQITNNLARKALGIADDQPITESAIKGIREQAGKSYEAIKSLPSTFKADAKFVMDISSLGDDFSAAAKEFPELANDQGIKTIQSALSKDEMSPRATMEVIKKLRQDGTANLKAFDDNSKIALGKAQRKAADAMEELIERNLASQGKSRLAVDFRKARTLIAKTHDVEAALLPDGNVSAQAIAKAMDKGKPMTGELANIAKFAGTFPKAAQNPAQSQSAGVSNLQGLSSFGLTALGGAAGGLPGSMIGALPIVAPPAARSLILSGPYQKLLQPNYQPSAASRLIEEILKNSQAQAGIRGALEGASQ